MSNCLCSSVVCACMMKRKSHWGYESFGGERRPLFSIFRVSVCVCVIQCSSSVCPPGGAHRQPAMGSWPFQLTTPQPGLSLSKCLNLCTLVSDHVCSHMCIILLIPSNSYICVFYDIHKDIWRYSRWFWLSHQTSHTRRLQMKLTDHLTSS